MYGVWSVGFVTDVIILTQTSQHPPDRQMSNNPNPTHDAFKSITCTKASGGQPQPPGKMTR